MQLHLFQSLSHNPFMFHKQHMFGEHAADGAAAALHTLYDLVLELSGFNLTLSLWTNLSCVSQANVPVPVPSQNQHNHTRNIELGPVSLCDNMFGAQNT